MEVLAAFLQTPKSFSRHLQRRCKRQKVFRGTCSVPAKAKTFLEALAAFLQTPFFSFGRLQKFCKLRFLLLGLCRSSASSDFSFLVFAEVLQAPFSPFGRLQNFCKRQKVFRGTCNNVANVPKNTLAVTVRYPRHSPEIRNLILSSNTRSVKTPDFKGDQRP